MYAFLGFTDTQTHVIVPRVHRHTKSCHHCLRCHDRLRCHLSLSSMFALTGSSKEEEGQWQKGAGQDLDSDLGRL